MNYSTDLLRAQRCATALADFDYSKQALEWLLEHIEQSPERYSDDDLFFIGKQVGQLSFAHDLGCHDVNDLREYTALLKKLHQLHELIELEHTLERARVTFFLHQLCDGQYNDFHAGLTPEEKIAARRAANLTNNPAIRAQAYAQLRRRV